MSPGTSSELKFDIGHVLFIDIVGYSKLLIAEQSEQMQTLREIVRGTKQFKKADAEGKLLRLPTGDGGALVFRNSLEAPVLCALEISKALKSHPELKVRMGIHSGPVNEITDLNEQANIAGVGINMAQRVMDCGDAGHILLSKRVADDLEQYPQWRSHLSDLGECEVKHGTRVSVVNLYTDDAGNRVPPEKFRSVEATVPAATHRTKRKSFVAAALILIALIIAAGIWLLSRQKGGLPSTASTSSSTSSAAPIPEKSIAVLPFENLSSDKENAYFAEGIQDEILTKLATIADLKVISRTSTAKYSSKPDDVKVVSQQLGAAKLLEGTVQRVGERLRVNVQLIDAPSDSHLWAKSYDGEAKDIFDIEGKVAQEVADLLQAKLSSVESERLTSAPTANTEAYDIFLKAEFEERRAEAAITADAFDRAAVLYREAISRDPNFALAHSRLVTSRMTRHWYIDRLSDAELHSVEEEARHAIELAPQLADTHVALGVVHYFGHRRYEEALSEFHKAIELQPNASRALEYSAYVHRRLGQWDESISELKKVIEQDPRNSIPVAELGITYSQLRMWEEADRFGRQSLALDPHDATAMNVLVYAALNGKGDVKEARRLLQSVPPDISLLGDIGHTHAEGLLGLRAFVSVLEKDFTAALNVFADANYGLDERRRGCGRMLAYLFAGQKAEAVTEAAKIQPIIELTRQRSPNDLDALIQASWLYLVLNRGNDAHEMATHAAQLLSPEKDALVGTFTAFNLAEIDAQTGRTADAVNILGRLLSMPAGMETTVASLKIHPAWDTIRNDPRFQQLLTMKEHIGP